MAHGIPNLDHDFVTARDREQAERLLRRFPESRRAFDGAEERTRRSTARARGAALRVPEAGDELSHAQQMLERRRAEIAARTGRPANNEELAPELGKVERARAAQAAAQADATRAMSAARDDAVIPNRLVRACVALLKLEAEGKRILQRKTNVPSGPWLESLTANIAAQANLRANIEKLRNAETPLEELRTGLVRELDEMAARDPFRVTAEGRWVQPLTAVEEAQPQRPGRIVVVTDLLPLVLHLHGPAIRKELLTRFDTAHRGDETFRLAKPLKEAELTKRRAELLELQYTEAKLRILLAGDSADIAFRSDMDPMAVLGLEVQP